MNFNDEYVSMNIVMNKSKSILNIKGNIKSSCQYNKIIIIASNPIDRMINYSGSGLPFPNEQIAFENTTNFKLIEKNGNIDVQFKYPNRFYSENGKHKINPSIFIELKRENEESFQLQYELKDLNPLKTLINRENRKGPEFYSNRDNILPIDTAENVMYAYSKAKLEHDIG